MRRVKKRKKTHPMVESCNQGWFHIKRFVRKVISAIHFLSKILSKISIEALTSVRSANLQKLVTKQRYFFLGLKDEKYQIVI